MFRRAAQSLWLHLLRAGLCTTTPDRGWLAFCHSSETHVTQEHIPHDVPSSSPGHRGGDSLAKFLFSLTRTRKRCLLPPGMIKATSQNPRGTGPRVHCGWHSLEIESVDTQRRGLTSYPPPSRASQKWNCFSYL